MDGRRYLLWNSRVPTPFCFWNTIVWYLDQPTPYPPPPSHCIFLCPFLLFLPSRPQCSHLYLENHLSQLLSVCFVPFRHSSDSNFLSSAVTSELTSEHGSFRSVLSHLICLPISHKSCQHKPAFHPSTSAIL